MEEKEKSLSQIFNEAAAAAYEAFPEKLDNLIILVTSSDTPVYLSPEVAEYLTISIVDIKKILEEEKNFMRASGSAALVYPDYPLNGDGMSVRLMVLNETSTRSLSPGYTGQMNVICNFDHELGHILVENGFSYNKHLSECAADAYAALRHLQRFGRDTDFFEYYNRASTIVFGLSPTHYTEAVLQKVKQLSGEKDLAGLSLRETAELAEEIATGCRLADSTLEKIRVAYAPVREACCAQTGDIRIVVQSFSKEDKDIWTLFCRETLAVMRKHQNDPDIFTAGKRFLEYPPRKKFMQELAKTDPFWKDALLLIDAGKAAPHPPPSFPKQ